MLRVLFEDTVRHGQDGATGSTRANHCKHAVVMPRSGRAADGKARVLTVAMAVWYGEHKPPA